MAAGRVRASVGFVRRAAGCHVARAAREDGQWKILRRVDYPVMPTQEEWMKFIREYRANGK